VRRSCDRALASAPSARRCSGGIPARRRLRVGRARPGPAFGGACARLRHQATTGVGDDAGQRELCHVGEFSPRSFRPGGMREFTVSKLSPPLNSPEPFPSALTAVLVFPLIPKPASCLQRVRLRLRVLGGRGPRAELAVYPSALLSLAKGRRPDRIPWDTLIDNRPRGLADVPLDVRWAEIDITELYRTWAGGAEFPSMGRSIPKGTLLVVSIRPPAWTNENDFVREFAGAAAGRAAPRLAWTASGACRR
jgi:hypothetical protein